MADPPPAMTPRVDEAMLAQMRSYLARHNWLAVHVPQDATTHTIGLTSYGLPELVVHDRHGHLLAVQLEQWAARLVCGDLELGATVTVHDLDLREHVYPVRVYDVAHRGGLWLARALYGPRMTAREVVVRACRCTACRDACTTGAADATVTEPG